MATLPTIDLNGAKKLNQQVVAQIRAALVEFGFFYVVGHGVDRGLQSRLEALAQQFFALPISEKMLLSMKNSRRAWRGYFPVGGELTSGRPDQKEGLYIGVEHDVNHPLVISGTPMHGQNLWPQNEHLQEFSKVVREYMAAQAQLGRFLLANMAVALAMEADYFAKRFTNDPTLLFRIFNYPEHKWRTEEDEWGVREHTDMGFLTILKQDQSGGLQVKDLSGRWLEAPPLDNSFVVNIGDMLDFWTNGFFRATPHRVRNQGKGDRLSFPFFYDPNWHSTLEPMARAASKDEITVVKSNRWDGIELCDFAGQTYGDFVWRKISKVFPDLA